MRGFRLTGCRVILVVICAVFALSSQVLGALPAHNPLKPPDTSSPRSTLQSFVTALDRAHGAALESGSREETVSLMRRALRCLDISELPPALAEARGTEHALMLKEVLDRITLPSEDKIPGQDQVNGARENIGLIRVLDALLKGGSGDGKLSSVGRAVDRWTIPNTEITIGLIAEGPREGEYLFTSDTVERVPDFYEAVRDLPYKADATPDIYRLYLTTPGAGLRSTWNQDLPAWSKRIIAGQTVWQWITSVLAIALAALLIRLLLRVGERWDAHRSSVIGDVGAQSLRLGAILAVVGAIGLVDATGWLVDKFINITGPPLLVMTNILVIARVVFFGWLAALALTQAAEFSIRTRKLAPKSAPSQLIRFVSRLIALAVIIVILIHAAQQIGLPAYSVVTGLGVGGLAVALAAKETLRDLFGALVIMLSRPFRIGDWVVLGDKEGTVEAIGFRSTRIRTFYDSQLSVPNGELLSMTIDNMGMRTYRRVYTTIGIRDDTAVERIEAFLEGIKRIILANPTTRKDYFHVVLHDFGDAGLDVMLYFFVEVPNWAEELAERQQIFLEVLRLAEALGVDLAPTQQIEVQRDLPASEGDDDRQDIPAGSGGGDARRLGAEGRGAG